MARPRPVALFRRLLELLILLMLLGLGLLLMQGGFEFQLFGLSVKATRLESILRFLLPLLLLRLFLGMGRREFLLFCSALAFGLLLAELSLRLLDPPLARAGMIQIHRPSTRFDWELIPQASGVGTLGEIIRINSLGMRDQEPAPLAERGRPRIAALGDSFTFGMGVAVEQAWPEQLQQRLRHQGQPAEVLNFGVIGYDLWQLQAVLAQQALPLRPDLIVIALFLDDLSECAPPWEQRSDWQPHNPFARMFAGERDLSAVWNLLRNLNHLFEARNRGQRGAAYLRGIAHRKQAINAGNPAYRSFYQIQHGQLPAARYGRCRQSLSALSRTAAEAGVPLLLALIPDASQLHEPDRQAVNRYLSTTSTELGISFIDLTAAFEAAADPRPLYLFPLDAHTSPAGHGLIAEQLDAALRERGLLQPAAHP